LLYNAKDDLIASGMFINGAALTRLDNKLVAIEQTGEWSGFY